MCYIPVSSWKVPGKQLDTIQLPTLCITVPEIVTVHERAVFMGHTEAITGIEIIRVMSS
jgi:hypothetical protein